MNIVNFCHVLRGKHLNQDCRKCHNDLIFSNTKSTCVSCHIDIHQLTVGQDCERCHSPQTWLFVNITEIHQKSRFPLTGQHEKTDCYDCHLSAPQNRFDPMGTKCIDCHLSQFTATLQPSHTAAKFPTDCFLCHTEDDWNQTKFDHNTTTVFPLTGAHTTVACASCHTNGYSGGPPTTCNACHAANYTASTNPNHASAKFSTDCKTCHTPTAWAPSSFNHNTATTFALSGSHVGVSCISCHAAGYAGIPTTCVSCHLDKYNATTNPNHVSAKISTDCISCHTPTVWSPASFDHNTATTFPLTGAHTTVACASCHINGYPGTPTDCYSCHLTIYNTTTNPAHATLKYPTDCKLCHTTTVWTTATFDHNTTTVFPLTGAHTTVACASCHTNGYTGGTPTTCNACHAANYTASTNPNHASAKFSTDCKTCHTPTAWAPSSFNHNTATTFALSGSHVGVTCISCHAAGYAGIPTTCVSCHLNDFNATTTPSHVAAKYPTDCKLCHTVTIWTTSTFNHAATAFPLTGAHITVDCSTCHTTGFTGGTPTNCSGCHLTNFNTSTNPNHATAKFSTDCKTCHTTTAWTPSSFNHNTATSFPLTGSHIGVTCINCHSKGYAGISTDCVSCHLNDFNSATLPSHVASKFPTDCSLCHTVTVWTSSTFNHSTTVFPLTGSHITVDCASCHTTGYNGGTPTNCSGCHLTDFNASTNPNHLTAKFSTDCKTCHTTTAWVPSSFNHSTSTSFPLTGSHIGVSCINCHSIGYAGISTDCVSCHQIDFNATTAPAHVAGKFPTDCKLCHTTTLWTTATFNHNTTTVFPLTGAHITVACATCHTNGYTGGTPTTCVGCHQNDFNASTNPNHTSAKFSTDCKTCHTPTAWAPSSFNHTTATTFPLTGSHIGVSCISCHSKGYAGISTDCVSCHQTDFNATTAPAHVAGKFPTDCKLCHATTLWSTATFNHNTTTVFPLTGAHITVACATCHTNGYTGGTPTTCVACHQNDFNASTNPNHTSAKFSTDCSSCHTSTAWAPSSFNHTTATSFLLTGAHIGVTCISCHTKGYAGISTDCVSCHLTEFNATTTPSHVTSKYPTDCTICHTITVWTTSTFNHATTAFPLTGAHLTVDCSTCHTTGFKGGTPTACSSCHLTNFNASTNPNHVLAKFPTDCKICHTTTAWIPNSFNHNTATTFPLTGAHVGVDCISCHSVGYIGISTACISCHQNDYNATTSPAHLVAKFPTDCKVCHTTTVWTPSIFNHSTGTTFPLTGSHIGVNCILCHSAGYAGISTQCVSCHLTEFNATTNPVHSTAKFPTNCEYCHSTVNWTSSTYNHDLMYFKIYSGRHLQQWTLCTQCHTTPTNYGVFSCLGCHAKATMDSAHKAQVKNGYVYTSAACMLCHAKV